MVPGSSIGAATVVQGGSGEAAPDKYQSYMRGLMRATAEARGRNPQIAEAMVDESIFVAGISDSGKVLTLSAEEALRVGIADEIVDDLSASIATMNLENVSRIDHQTSGVERFLRFFGSPVVQSILMMMMLGGLYFELQTPGVGFPGLMSAIGASLFFAPNYLYGLVEVWEVALFVLGVILIILELLVFPGFGISGILGGTLVLGSLVISMVGNVGFSFPDSTAVYRAINTLVISFFLTVGVSLYVGKRIVRQGSALSKLVLQPELDRSSGYVSAVSHVELVGAVGETLTPLRPSGVADIGGVRVDVVSQGDFIASGERIEVIRVQGSRVLVKRAAAGGQQA
jgi:membrane-bound serine protease (ClpP class)